MAILVDISEGVPEKSSSIHLPYLLGDQPAPDIGLSCGSFVRTDPLDLHKKAIRVVQSLRPTHVGVNAHLLEPCDFCLLRLFDQLPIQNFPRVLIKVGHVIHNVLD